MNEGNEVIELLNDQCSRPSSNNMQLSVGILAALETITLIGVDKTTLMMILLRNKGTKSIFLRQYYAFKKISANN